MPVHSFSSLRGRVEHFELESRHLASNLLGDPARRSIAVYLPPGYDASTQRYPLCVGLAAFTGSGLKYLAWSAFGETLPQRLERLVAEGRMGPVVLALPDAFTSLGGNQYVDSPAMGHWERWLLEDALPAIEARYRVHREPARRVIFGKSSGGYGALWHALRHGSQWGAAICHSGDLGFELLYARDFATTLDVLARHGGSIETFLAKLAREPKLSGGDFHALMVLAMGASYDPDPSAPKGIRLPVDPHTAELVAERWERWLAFDPVCAIETPRAQESLGSLRALFLDCGRRDQYLLHYGLRRFTRRLSALGIAHEHQEFDDDHSGIDYRLDVSLPWAYAHITA
ncbi:MAG: enterochelin esterase [Planctomycetes bacterium]|nr:enterochelin esterase [Planctomycetota bacterium]